jgi:hypothetical protein
VIGGMQRCRTNNHQVSVEGLSNEEEARVCSARCSNAACEETPRRAAGAVMHDGAVSEEKPSKGVYAVRGGSEVGHSDVGSNEGRNEPNPDWF